MPNMDFNRGRLVPGHLCSDYYIFTFGLSKFDCTLFNNKTYFSILYLFRHMKNKHSNENDAIEVTEDNEDNPEVTEYDEVTGDTEYIPEGSDGSDNEVNEVTESGSTSVKTSSGRHCCPYCDLSYKSRWSVGR